MTKADAFNVQKLNDVTALLQQHRSIRKFTARPLEKEKLEEILRSAQAAPTSSHVQAYTIIGITDRHKRERLAEYAGNQAYVASCAHFLVFCADLHRLHKVTGQAGVDSTAALESTEKFMVATIDAALAAQNAAIAAESLGLGIVYIGGLRNNPDKVSAVLNLPPKVYPVFGMCLGYPDQDPERKPRLPLDVIYAENEYHPFDDVKQHLAEYDREVKAYYEQRTNGKRRDTWTEMMSKLLQKPTRMHMKSFLKERGFPLK